MDFYFLAAPLLGLSARLVYLQAVKPRDPKAGGFALAKLTQRQEIPARRADILAADGSALAVTLDEYTVVANPRAIPDKTQMAQKLAAAIGGEPIEYSNLLQKTTRPMENRIITCAWRVTSAKRKSTNCAMK